MDETSEFLNLCLTVLNEVIDIFNMMMGFWYLRLLFVAGLIWLGFDIFEEISNIHFEDRNEWR